MNRSSIFCNEDPKERRFLLAPQHALVCCGAVLSKGKREESEEREMEEGHPPPSLYVERPWEERASRGGKKSIERPAEGGGSWDIGVAFRSKNPL